MRGARFHGRASAVPAIACCCVCRGWACPRLGRHAWVNRGLSRVCCPLAGQLLMQLPWHRAAWQAAHCGLLCPIVQAVCSFDCGPSGAEVAVVQLRRPPSVPHVPPHGLPEEPSRHHVPSCQPMPPNACVPAFRLPCKAPPVSLLHPPVCELQSHEMQCSLAAAVRRVGVRHARVVCTRLATKVLLNASLNQAVR
jgi:hypothetical protein